MTAGSDKIAIIWDAESGEQLYQLIGHTDWVYTAFYSQDGKSIVTASRNNTAILWDVVTHQPIRSFIGHTNNVISAVFHPDGKRIITASVDQTARVWLTSLQDMLTLAHSLIQRDPPVFTAEERQRFGIEENP